jgi:hypothetical protein
MIESTEDKCRSKMAKMFNQPGTQWIPNLNTGFGYISGRPDAEVRYGRNCHVDIECKGDEGSLFLGDPGNEDSTVGWHFHQRQWWSNLDKPVDAPYFVAVLVTADRNNPRVDYKEARMFLVPPEAWLALEQKLAGRKTVALNPGLERVHANKAITLESEWGLYRLDYENGQYRIPETHPLYQILH